MNSEALGWGVGVLMVVVIAAAIGLRLLFGRSGQRAKDDADQQVATLAAWAQSRGWQRVPAPPEPAVARRVTVRGLNPLLVVRGMVDTRPVTISVWQRMTSKLGSPVTFRTTTWTVSTTVPSRPAGSEVFALGRLSSGGATVGPPNAVAARPAVFPWGHGQLALWPAPDLPADAARLRELAARLDAVSGFLLVDQAGLSINLPYTPPEETLRLLRLALATLTPTA